MSTIYGNSVLILINGEEIKLADLNKPTEGIETKLIELDELKKTFTLLIELEDKATRKLILCHSMIMRFFYKPYRRMWE